MICQPCQEQHTICQHPITCPCHHAVLDAQRRPLPQSGPNVQPVGPPGQPGVPSQPTFGLLWSLRAGGS